jgi:hypothetical protein
MRATTTQRQKDGGVFGQRAEYYVDCTVEFTEQERERIKANPDTLLTHVISAGHDLSYGEFRWSPRSYARGAPFVLVLVLAVGIPTISRPITDHFGEVLVLLLLVGYCIFNIFDDHEGFPASDRIRAAFVLDQPIFSVYAESADVAETVAADICTRLNDLDALLKESPAAVDGRAAGGHTGPNAA